MDVCITGVGRSDFTRGTDESVADLATTAAVAAVIDAGIDRDQVDGIIVYHQNDSLGSRQLADLLGLKRLRWFSDNKQGGPATVGSVIEAAAIISAGLASHVLVVRAMRGYSGMPIGRWSPSHPIPEMVSAREHGFGLPAHVFGLWASRLESAGIAHAERREVALLSREGAMRNPRSPFFAKPLDEAEYDASPVIAEPLRRHDCCLEIDGAVALLVSRAKSAGVDRSRDVRVAAMAYTAGPGAEVPYLQWPDHTKSYASALSDELWSRSPIRAAKIESAFIYDAFTFMVPLQLRDLGVIPSDGAICEFLGAVRQGGAIPVNPHGGMLGEGYIHGLSNLAAAVDHLRGESVGFARKASTALVTGWGGSSGGALVLVRDG